MRLLYLWLMLISFSLINRVSAHRDDLIVTFHKFDSLSTHEIVVCNALRSLFIACNFRPRSPRAHQFPTDFVVLASPHHNVLSIVNSLSSVRRVHFDVQAAPRTLFHSHGKKQRHHLTGGGRLQLFSSGDLWARGFTGANVKVAVFDTGLVKEFGALANIAERTDWTGEGVRGDAVGHGTFVAGLVAGRHPNCPGMAPDAIIYSMRVFTGAQVSYTSWFLDAFNYALYIEVDVLNLSIGGPDFADIPFVDKVNELSAAGVIVVSAIGNDGPRWGTLNNPGDMLDVVGVGGVEPDGSIAVFSSRGATAHNFEDGRRRFGRVKPDIVAYARNLVAPSHKDIANCKTLSGTSVASPVVAGAVALVISAIPPERRKHVANPASVKRAFMQSAKRLSESSMYEQGAGLIDISAAVDVMLQIDAEFRALERALAEVDLFPPSSMTSRFLSSDSGIRNRSPGLAPKLVRGPNAYLFPEHIDMTTDDCRLMWPHCAQPMYVGGDWHTFNISILNPAGVSAHVADVVWIPYSNGEMLEVTVSLPERFWPWATGLGLHIRAIGEDVDNVHVIEGSLTVVVVTGDAHSTVVLPIRAEVAPRPLRNRRLLWDIFHSIQYPPGYVPRDGLVSDKKDMLDWLGDSPFTNYRRLFRALRKRGYFVDLLDKPLTCIGRNVGKQYGALLILDSEDYFFESERRILRNAVINDGLALIVAAEWYSTDVMEDIRFNDDNTRSRWTPVVGGGNTHSLNILLQPFGIAFGNRVVSGHIDIGSFAFQIDSGAPIVAFPKHGELVNGKLETRRSKKRKGIESDGEKRSERFGVLGMAFYGRGAILAICDTHLIDGAHRGGASVAGIRLFLRLLRHVAHPPVPRRPLFPFSTVLTSPLLQPKSTLDPRASSAFALFVPHSRVLARTATMDNLVERDCRALCELYESRMSQPRINEPRPNDSFVIHTKQHASLVGSENKYFASFNVDSYFTSRLIVEEEIMASNESTTVQRVFFAGGAWIGIIVGVMLMIAAIMMPMGKRSQVLRMGRERQLRRLHGSPWRSVKRFITSNVRDE